MSTANADMDLPPPYHIAVQNSTQALGAYHSENTTDIVQVQPISEGPAQSNIASLQQTTAPKPSMNKYIILACCLICCGNVPFGLCAFYLAHAGKNASTPEKAWTYGISSMMTSITGILLSVFVLVFMLVFYNDLILNLMGYS